MPSRLPALLAVLVVVVAVVIAAYHLRHDRAQWSPDAAIYLRMALQDRGVPPAEALRETDRFALEQTTLGADPLTRTFYGAAPPVYYRDQFGLFVSRPLYPAVASLLLPRFGPFGLKVVSAVAFVAAALLMYGLLLAFVPAWAAAVGALALALTPDVQGLSAAPLTDALALCFWIAVMAALFRYLRSPSALHLTALVAATALLAFTRPAIHLPLGAALAVALVAPRGSVLRGSALRAATGVVAVGIAFAVFSALVHGPGVSTQLRWLYDWQVATHESAASHGFAAWWVRSAGGSLAEELLVGIYKANMLLTVVLAVLGLLLRRRDVVAPVVIGAVVAALAGIAVTPLDVARTVGVPIAAALIVPAAIAIARLGRAAVERPPAAVSP